MSQRSRSRASRISSCSTPGRFSCASMRKPSMFSAGAAAAMARGRCGVLLLLFLVLGIRVSWGQGGRHTGVARVRAVHGDATYRLLPWGTVGSTR